MLLSICLIARNEDRFLPACLDSLDPLLALGNAEVVVVDTGSTDRTAELARSRNCRVLSHRWHDDFSAARNCGLAAARGQWILCIDADERLLDPAPLLQTVRSAAPAVGGFLVERHDLVTDPEDGRTLVNPIGLVRLFRNDPRIRYTGIVHERPGDTILRAGLAIHTALDVKLAHLVNHLPPDKLRAKQERYLALLDRELDANPHDHWARYYRGKTRWYLGRIPEAVSDFDHVTRAPADQTDLQPWSHNMLAALYAEAGQPDLALGHLNQSLSLRPAQSLAYGILGDLHYRQGDYRAALAAYQQVRLTLDPVLPNGQVQGDLYMTPGTHSYKLGSCHLALGDLPTAAAHFTRGAQLTPPDAACHLGLAHVALALGDLSLARSLLTTAADLDPTWQLPRQLLEDLPAPAPAT